MLPRGDAHILRDGPESKVVPFESLSPGPEEGRREQTLRYGRNGAETVLLAGEFVFDSPFALPIVRGMDRVVHVRAESDENMSTFSQVLKMLCREGRSSEPGCARGLLRPAEARVHPDREISTWRNIRNREDLPENHPLALIFDKELHGVTEALHRNPERPWTVADMAAQAEMSRTKFSLRFAEVPA